MFPGGRGAVELPGAGGEEEEEVGMHHMPAGDHSATQISKPSEIYKDKCGYLLKRSGGKHSSMTPRGIKVFSFGQLTCARELCPPSLFQVRVCASSHVLHLTLLCATDGVRSKHWDTRFFQIIGTDLVWGADREDIVNQVGLKRFDLMGCRVELRSEEKATTKGYRPRFKLVHPDRTLTFEVPSNGVPFAEIKEAVAAWSAVLMSAIEKANMGAEGAALRAAQSRSPEEAAALAARLMSQYDPDFAPQFDVDEDDDFHDATADSLQDTVTAVFECDGALGMSLVAQEIRSNELPPGWSQTQEEDGRVVYLMPGGEGRQYQRPKANEHQCVQIQSISQTGLVGTGQYFEKNSSQVDFLQVGMVLDALNGESVAGVSFKKIMQSIKAAGRPVELTFHMPIDGQVETLTPRKRDALQSFGERDGGLEAAPARSAAQFNRTVGPKTVEASAQSSMVSVSAQSPRRVRAETAGPADYDDPKDEAAGASDDDDYVDASTQLQSFRSLQGSAEMLDKEIAMFHIDMASTPRAQERNAARAQGTTASNSPTRSTPYHGRRGDQDGLLQRLQSVYAQHEAEFEVERAMRLAQLGDPTALTPTQQLLKERQEHAAEKAKFEAERTALKNALRAAQDPSTFASPPR